MRATITDGGYVAVTLEGAAEVEALLADLDDYDQRHPIDRLLISSGVRWATLRHIAAPARCDLVRWVLERNPAPDTLLATSPDTWMDAVTDLIQQQTGTEFRYRSKQRRWWLIANVFRRRAQWDGRPLTWISQGEIAAAIGCSTRTVRRCVSWLQQTGLLHEVVPGCQLPRQATPDDETSAEQTARLTRRAAAIAAEDAAIRRARAELARVRPHVLADAGSDDCDPLGSTPEPVAESSTPRNLDPAPLLPDLPLIQLVPVYELRVPAPPDLAGVAVQAVSCTAPQSSASHDHPQSDPLTSADHDGSAGLLKNDHPPQVVALEELQSKPVHLVDKRPAPPGLDRSEPRQPGSGSRQSEAVRAATWLLTSRLHPDLCIDVSTRWLAALIRDSRLLSAWEWSWDDLAALIHGSPDYPHLPRWIRNPRGWIKARFRQAVGPLSPTKLALIQHIERASPALRQHRADELEAARRTQVAALRTAIAACPLCDELGWQDADPTNPGTTVFRCNHDPTTGGW